MQQKKKPRNVRNCVRCQKDFTPSGKNDKRCIECRPLYNLEYLCTRRKKIKHEGLCQRCGKEPVKQGKKTCQNCMDRVYYSLVKGGICINCAVGSATAGVLCETCWRNNFNRRYEFTIEDFKKVVALQKGECALKGFGDCSIPRITPGNVVRGSCLVPDHDHLTGRLRMALCGNHNNAIGKFGDNIIGIKKLLSLLEHPPAAFLYEGIQ